MGVFFGVRPPISTEPPVPPGPDANTMLLLHGDESPLIDSSPSPKTLTLNGGIARSSLVYKFGGYSIALPSNTTNIVVPSTPDLYLNGNYTIDFWMRPSTGTTPATVYSQGSASNNFFELYIDRVNGRFYVRLNQGGTYYVNQAFFYTPNVWSHFAVTGDQTNTRAYLNGNLQWTDGYLSSQMPAQQLVRIGRDSYFNRAGGVGYLDEFRVSNVVRWTSNFTPPTEPY